MKSQPDADAALSLALEQLEQQKLALQRSREALDAFASIASHDLAQPLQVAFGYLELVRTEFGPALDPVVATWLAAASSSLERMRQLVQEILAFARADVADAPPGRVDLGVAAGTAVGRLTALVAERNATVDVGPLPTVPGNETQLVLLFENLIGNGVTYTPTDRAPHVRVSASQTPDGVLVDIDDNGDGVPFSQREQVFDPFNRNHGTDVSGTGLGLAICRKIAVRHHGRIWVEDSPSGGARLRLLLPN